MSRSIPRVLRRIVLRRAQGRCEYCGLSQTSQEATFHIDHIVPVSVGGETVAENLALAWVSCSLRKAARLSAVDPESEKEVPLFNPRRDAWQDHFQWDGVHLSGLTETERATVVALRMNRPQILAIRAEEAIFGRHPPERA